MSLFQHGSFILHSGCKSNFLIDCEQLTDDSLRAIALLAKPLVYPFGEVFGIPRGGLRFAEAMRAHSTKGPRLVVDDVWTTGGSMVEVLQPGDKGLVIFARHPMWWLTSAATESNIQAIFCFDRGLT